MMYSELVLHTKTAMTGQKVLLFLIQQIFSTLYVQLSLLAFFQCEATFGRSLFACDFDIHALHHMFCE